MKNIFVLALFVFALSGCAHKELKAPCTNVAAFASGSIPCDQRQPISTKTIPTTFAK